MENSVEKKKGFTKRGQPSVGTDACPASQLSDKGRKEGVPQNPIGKD